MGFLFFLLLPALFYLDDSSDDNAGETSSGEDPNAEPEVPTIEGTDGNETILGTDQGETIFGYGGNDYVYAGDGDDTVIGGESLTGDLLSGGEGDDELRGGAGRDLFFGGPGDDVMYGGAELDIFVGEEGNDTAYGSLQEDVFMGYNCSNLQEAIAIPDPDLVIQFSAHDQEDVSGADSFYGGYGEDLFILGGDDTATGGEGDDTFFVPHNAEGFATITDFTPNEDVLVVSYALTEGANIGITEDDDGNALVSVNGDVIAVLNDMAGQISMSNINLVARNT